MNYKRALSYWYSSLVVLIIGFIFCSHVAVAQQTALALSSGTANPGGSVTLNVSLTDSGGAIPAGLQWTIGYPTADITGVTANVSPTASAAGKSVTCFSNSGSSNCILYGIDNTSIPSGQIATITFQIASAAPAGTAPVSLTGSVATDPTGSSISATGSGGTITIQSSAPVATTTTLSSSSTSLSAGQSVSFTAAVAPASGTGTPTGTVTFHDGATSLG
ncbi:MAG TPA: cohesin domain-containing protein, partial [Acidisarcina sp.]|nr:cohesin domain-containing protein [Acidisarcina sp.]